MKLSTKTIPPLTAAALVAAFWTFPQCFTWNDSASLPKGLYLRQHRAFARGDIVEVCLPESVAAFAVSRAYIAGSGKCGNSEPLVKYVIGMPGDIVKSKPLKVDRRGRPMTTRIEGFVKIPPGAVWVDTRVWNSFGSRYFGPLPDEDVKAVLTPLLTWNDGRLRWK